MPVVQEKPVSAPSTGWREPQRQPVERHGTERDWIEAGTHFRMEGQGPAVILIHGVGLDLTMWAAQVAALKDRYTVIRYDMIGHGLSAKPPGARRLKDYVIQLENLVRYLELDQVALVGFSMGGLVARGYAERHPARMARLVIMNSVYQRSDDQQAAVMVRYRQAEDEGPQKLIEAALDRWFSPAYAKANPDVLAAVRARLESNDRQGFLAAYRLFAKADQADAGRISAINCPTLVCTGASDGGSSPEMASRMAAAIPGARCHIWPGLRHMAPVEGAKEVSETLLDFLGEGE
ncbi:alpha/beta fold hydrolase [Aestuariispira insulae]|uniref:3-oxoadipate enol-lactonase n=1 Tax=Aestuariispira insulae TaxID=1461337 RepID=A0A3D9H5Q2_9PROT|nr:alpha/beta fold hydrolase [Aestuariispira insulae]RED44814.1 3-oxoadipate enol-lactonase [Aestuariispira insulae]